MTEYNQMIACESLYDALRDAKNNKAVESLSTQDLLAIQTLINEILIRRFKPLHQAIQSLIELETTDFNKHIKV